MMRIHSIKNKIFSNYKNNKYSYTKYNFNIKILLNDSETNFPLDKIYNTISY